jgi:hypothetical protein
VIQCLLPSAVTSLGSPAKLLSLATGALSAWTSEYNSWDATGVILSRLSVFGTPFGLEDPVWKNRCQLKDRPKAASLSPYFSRSDQQFQAIFKFPEDCE